MSSQLQNPEVTLGQLLGQLQDVIQQSTRLPDGNFSVDLSSVHLDPIEPAEPSLEFFSDSRTVRYKWCSVQLSETPFKLLKLIGKPGRICLSEVLAFIWGIKDTDDIEGGDEYEEYEEKRRKTVINLRTTCSQLCGKLEAADIRLSLSVRKGFVVLEKI